MSIASFSIIFSHSESCLLTFLTVCFVMQKLFMLIRSHLFTLPFISNILGGGSWKILLWFILKSVLPVISCTSFIVSGLTFRSLIYFEVIFVYGVIKCSSFILVQMVDQFSEHHFLFFIFFSIYFY